MSVYVTFFKPHGVFEGSFNHLVSWWTGGDFCHCEIVFALAPGHLMRLLKRVYDNQTETDQKRLMPELENNFYENKEFRQIVQNEKEILISFSLLWGDKLRARFVSREEEYDPWKQLSNENISIIEYKSQSFDEMCLFSLRNLGKPYNVSLALTSWMPSFGLSDSDKPSSYFCSEFVADVLKKDHRLSCTSFRTTPNHLYQLLKIQDRQDAEDDARRQDLLESLNQSKASVCVEASEADLTHNKFVD